MTVTVIWLAHPFMEGNTRTTAVFMECYLRHLRFEVDNDMFKECSKYFRNSLVRANFADYAEGIVETDGYLIKAKRCHDVITALDPYEGSM